MITQLKFALRHLLRSGLFTSINVAGLAISLTAVVLMALYIEDELSYDTFNKNAQQIYRVVDDKQTNALFQHGAGSPGPLAPALLNDFPQVKVAVRFIDGESLVKYENKAFEERHIFYADPEVFNVFSFPLVYGDPSTALNEPRTVVMTQTTALKYFGNKNAIGKIVTMNGDTYRVTGIAKDIPSNSHIQFDILASMATAQAKGSGYDWLFTNWYSNNFHTYILLPKIEDNEQLISQMAAFANRHNANTNGTTHHYGLEKLNDIYLHSDRENQIGKTGNIRSLYVFAAIAFFVLLIASINFINLSTARATERAKEVGIKKVNGVSRPALVAQFFFESFLMVGVAALIAIFAAAALLPIFNEFSGKTIEFALFKPAHIVGLVAAVIIVSSVSGIYPALILSGFNPVAAIKGRVRTSSFNIGMRKALVVFQFSVSIILIISCIVVFTQLKYMQTHDLGFKTAQTMVINFEGDNSVQKNYKYIESEILKKPGVKSVSASSAVPGNLISGWSMDFAKKNGDTVHAELPIYLTDFSFMRQYNIPMVAGRGLSSQFAADTVESMVINETALKKLGFNNPEEAIGAKVGMYPNDAKIIGVFKDFHYESLQHQIGPLAMRILPGNFRLFSVEIGPQNVPATVQAIEELWKNIVPQRPLEYTFLNNAFNEQYKAEIKFGQLFSLFTGLAIAIACFGLFGLSLFSVKQRKLEIGIRKVIGASAFKITLLITKDFLSLVALAVVIAFPIALYFMSHWLQEFAYRIQISWWIFVIGGGIAALVALLTISFHAIRAAIANPINSLKNE
ncbi:ABC transporter permease [Mucilaginibacter pedocola]|uniref:Uncharacterized protein n=1 Tax=Mucilaginibacter pedocola TaxID=1792845 RepID=A0A1S9PHA6_9SPHI|nr:ABC transporter permease [Mucilaginibacter pedocola]OOQ60346.1 hypothetical protein BC343_25315 [Mucilaginibacter pedocola]